VHALQAARRAVPRLARAHALVLTVTETPHHLRARQGHRDDQMKVGSGPGRDAVEALLRASRQHIALFGKKTEWVAPFARIVCTPPRTPSA
jgi:hypothetical protein